MKKFQRKPTEIEAVRVTSDWFGAKFKFPFKLKKGESVDINGACRRVFLPKGATAELNDWVLRYNDGRFEVLNDIDFRREFEGIADEAPKGKPSK